MSPDQYLNAVISKYPVTQRRYALAALCANQLLVPVMKQWAGQCLNQIRFCGSFAKGTAISGAVDVDLFVSLRSSTPVEMRTIYFSLLSYMEASGFTPTAQNVSIGVEVRHRNACFHYDLVPARRRPGVTNDHILYRREADTWTLTNVWKHIRLIRGSGRRPEILATKIWRGLSALDFPSFYLELSVLRALKGYPLVGQRARNFLKVLAYLSGEFEAARVEDPSNSGNVVSDDLTLSEKRSIVRAAQTSLARFVSARDLAEVIW